jgi:hypothetical protein
MNGGETETHEAEQNDVSFFLFWFSRSWIISQIKLHLKECLQCGAEMKSIQKCKIYLKATFGGWGGSGAGDAKVKRPQQFLLGILHDS